MIIRIIKFAHYKFGNVVAYSILPYVHFYSLPISIYIIFFFFFYRNGKAEEANVLSYRNPDLKKNTVYPIFVKTRNYTPSSFNLTPPYYLEYTNNRFKLSQVKRYDTVNNFESFDTQLEKTYEGL